MGRQLLLTYMEVDRIFASRKNENGGKDYYVKWRNLPYSEATWEDEFNINNYYAEALDKYNQRLKNRTNPRSYASAMKNVSVKIFYKISGIYLIGIVL
jgi:Chromo (CHRromatin Organisation MOdifier) domain